VPLPHNLALHKFFAYGKNSDRKELPEEVKEVEFPAQFISWYMLTVCVASMFVPLTGASSGSWLKNDSLWVAFGALLLCAYTENRQRRHAKLCHCICFVESV